MLARLLKWLFFPWLAERLRNLSRKSGKVSRPHFEVERKFPLSAEEYDEMPKRLKALGFVKKSRATITDTFLPAEKVGEMIRVRDEAGLDKKAGTTVLTLKEWVEVEGGRERQENESDPLDTVTRACLISLGKRLAKGDLLSYSKERTTFRGLADRQSVTVALDLATGLGRHSGPYLEVEVIARRKEDVASARALVERFVKELLGAEREEAMSYMEMLKESRK